MKNIYSFSSFINEELTDTRVIQKGDPRINFVENFTQCLGGPAQGIHGTSKPIWQNRNAWDIAAPIGSKVLSICDGRVISSTKTDGKLVKTGGAKVYGDRVTVKSSDGSVSVYYTHIDTLVSVNDEVKVGDVIGTLKSVEGIRPHLHIALSDNKHLLDYLPIKMEEETESNKIDLPDDFNVPPSDYLR